MTNTKTNRLGTAVKHQAHELVLPFTSKLEEEECTEEAKT